MKTTAETNATDWESESTSQLVTSDRQASQPIVPDEFIRGTVELNRFYDAVKSLYTEPETDDFVRPAPDVLDRLIDVLSQTAYALMKSGLPAGYVTTDDEGGVRLEWWYNRNTCVQLIIGEKRSYVFHKFGNDDPGNIDRTVLPHQLASRLRRLEPRDTE